MIGWRTGLCSLQSEDAREPLEVVGHGLESEFELVLGEAQVAHAPVVLPFFEMGKDTLDVRAHADLAAVVLDVRFGELDVAGTLSGDAAPDAVRLQLRVVGFGVIGFVGIDGSGVRGRDAREDLALIRARC